MYVTLFQCESESDRPTTSENQISECGEREHESLPMTSVFSCEDPVVTLVI